MTSDAAILEAALEQLALTGVRRTSTDDIARRAGVNRATLYRRFGGREQLLSAAYLHEAERVVATLARTVPDPPPPGAGPGFDAAANIVDHFMAAITLVRDNDLLSRMLLVDREDTLASLTVDAGPILTFCSQVLADRIRALRRWAELPEESVDDLAIMLTRLAQSLVLTPDGPPRLRSRADFDRFGRAVIVPLILS